MGSKIIGINSRDNKKNDEQKGGCLEQKCHYAREENGGQCFRYPPSPFPMPAQHPLTGEPSISVVSVYPSLIVDRVCGEYLPSLEIDIKPGGTN